MNMLIKTFLLLLISMFVSVSGYSLSHQNVQFADDADVATLGTGQGGAIANGATEYSVWFDIRHFHYVDFTVLSATGTGTIEVQYASDLAKQSTIDDGTPLAFAVGTPATLFGGGMTKDYVRLKVTCDAGPNCTIDGWFIAKGGNYR